MMAHKMNITLGHDSLTYRITRHNVFCLKPACACVYFEEKVFFCSEILTHSQYTQCVNCTRNIIFCWANSAWVPVARAFTFYRQTHTHTKEIFLRINLHEGNVICQFVTAWIIWSDNRKVDNGSGIHLTYFPRFLWLCLFSIFCTFLSLTATTVPLFLFPFNFPLAQTVMNYCIFLVCQIS